MLIEFREYTCLPGMRDSWVRLMEEKIVPFQTAKGVVVLGMWVSETDPDVYFWMRRFDNEAERLRIYDEVYKSDTWLNELKPLVDAHLDRSKFRISRMEPTARSVMQ